MKGLNLTAFEICGLRPLWIDRDIYGERLSPPCKEVDIILDDQTQVDSKPVGQPEHASLNQCQLIAPNRCSGHPQLVVEIRFLCNVIDTRALIGPCSHVTSC